MLVTLTIDNLAVVDSVDLELNPGMTALTGETGAGKSILVDAIGLVLGDRADNAMIRAGCDRAEVTAGFDIAALPEAASWLQDHGIAHDDECLIRRTLVRDGRSRAFVNGTPVTIADLGALGACLLDIHGQHAHQSLTRRAYQRELLDAYGGHQPLAEEVAGIHRSLRAMRERLQRLRLATDEQAARADLLRFQLGELEEAQLAEGEWAQLEQEHERLSNAESLRLNCEAALAALADEAGVEERLYQARREVETLAAVDPALQECLQLLQSALIEVQEAMPTLRHYADSLTLDPERLEAVDERIGLLHQLARKYRVEPDALTEKAKRLAEELAAIDNRDAAIAALEKEMQSLQASYTASARKLSGARADASRKLGREITASLQTLGMKGGQFSVLLEALNETDAGAHGAEQITFLVTANPGMPEQPLAQVASGGELSRISLAIQVALANYTRVPTLIFDEVDVGIGGGTAEIVGRLLRRIGDRRQVLCVTHLPQVAAQAHHQLRVSKAQQKAGARTLIETLDPDGRIEEVARMLGGVRITQQSRAHAREMLSLASDDAAAT